MSSAATPISPASLAAPSLEAGAEIARVLQVHGADVALTWSREAVGSAAARSALYDDLSRLLAALAEVFIEGRWEPAQRVIDEAAQRRARGHEPVPGFGATLLKIRHLLGPLYRPKSRQTCEDAFLDVVQECVLRFAESYQSVKVTSEMERLHTRTIKALVIALEARDPYTKGHSLSVALLAQRVAEEMGSVVDPVRVYLAGLLHDVGKVGVPDRILQKRGPLSRRDWERMRRHPEIGASILAPVRLYPDIVDGVLTHHENFDGSGYPRGTATQDIPLVGRILRVADTFDAITSIRAHRASRPIAHAIEEIVTGRGTAYDPDVADAFVSVMDDPVATGDMSMAAVQMDLVDFVIPA